MRWLSVVVASCLAASVCFGQINRGNYGTQSGYGNILYPGTGHAPNVPNGGLYGSGVNRTSHVGPLVNRAYRGGSNRTLVVPFPVYYGPMGYGYDQSAGGPAPGQESGAPPIINPNAAPSVVINQTFVPDRAMPLMQDYNGMNGPPPGPEQSGGMRMYQGPAPATMPDPRAGGRRDDQPTLYLIAFNDHTIVQALGYWVEDGNLHYVSAEHTLNQVSLDLLDRELSQRLNDERNVEFKLPR